MFFSYDPTWIPSSKVFQYSLEYFLVSSVSLVRDVWRLVAYYTKVTLRFEYEYEIE